jgi:hypothetical protein
MEKEVIEQIEMLEWIKDSYSVMPVSGILDV